MKNFHVPLPDATYEHLRIAAQRSKVPATVLARDAIDAELRHTAIAGFAAEYAGTDRRKLTRPLSILPAAIFQNVESGLKAAMDLDLRSRLRQSVLRHAAVHLVAPRQNSAPHVAYLGEPGFLQ